MSERNIAGRYRVSDEIGRGGMGVVYDAVHTWTGRRVALKQLHPRLAADPSIAHRFAREARTGAKLRHPHLVDVLDMGAADDGAPFFVMERLDGTTLAALLAKKGRLTPAQTCSVMIPILDALEFLHRHRVLHRDIKPANVFLSVDATGRLVPKLLDLGIVEHAESAARGAGPGTQRYMAPERRRGEPSSERSDLWSAAVVFYECLTGARFDGRVESIPDLDGEVEIRSVLESALADAPGDRPESVRAFRDRVRRVAPAHELASSDLDVSTEVEAVLPQTETQAPPVTRVPPRSRARWLAVALATSGAIAIGAWALATRPADASTKREVEKPALVQARVEPTEPATAPIERPVAEPETTPAAPARARAAIRTRRASSIPPAAGDPLSAPPPEREAVARGVNDAPIILD